MAEVISKQALELIVKNAPNDLEREHITSYIYKNPKFYCPDPLEQFDIQLKNISLNKEYCIQEKFYSSISIQNIQKHIRLFN